MADPKDKGKEGKDGKAKAPPSSGHGWEIIIVVIIALALLVKVVLYLLGVFGFRDSSTGQFNERTVENFKILFTSFLNTLQLISLFISLLFVIGILYVKFKTYELERLERLKKKVKEINDKKTSEKPFANKKWLKVQEHIRSANSSDWRLAILEADILLNEVLDKMGFKGMTIGDKLKDSGQNSFTNINAAWEAHKTRNLIAHEGSDFSLSQREATRIIGLYELVFKELRYI